jgi:phenylalanyl-tRNA synthetase beta chain
VPRAAGASSTDFVEEVARLAGYDRVPESMPRVRLQPNPGLASRWIEKAARERLAGLGLFEMVNLRFTAPEWNRRIAGIVPEGAQPVPLANPLSSETSEMATSLLPNLLLAARRNRHQGERSVRAFEIGRSFWRTARDSIAEGRRIGGILLGPRPSRGIRHEDRLEDFLDLKGVLEDLFAALSIPGVRWCAAEPPRHLHPGKAARLRIGTDRAFGYAGAVHPEVAQAADLEGEVWAFELDFENLALYASRRFQFRSLAKFPSVTRSLAVVTDEGFESSAIVESVAARPELLVEEIRLFDVYRGAPIPAGKKSLAYSIAYRSPDRTLTDTEVNELHQQLTADLVRRFGVEPRT